MDSYAAACTFMSYDYEFMDTMILWLDFSFLYKLGALFTTCVIESLEIV